MQNLLKLSTTSRAQIAMAESTEVKTKWLGRTDAKPYPQKNYFKQWTLLNDPALRPVFL